MMRARLLRTNSSIRSGFAPRNGFQPRLTALEDRLAPAIFEVGSGLAYPSVGSVPWNNLTAGDTVNIHWRSSTQGGDYREKINISGQGTAANPIRVIGVPGPNGEKPVINGQNATTGANNTTSYVGSQTRGLITFSRSGSSQDYNFYKPVHIIIDGLVVRGANPSNTFKDSAGTTVAYAANAASVYIERGSNITIRNCEITDSGNGFFAGSNHYATNGGDGTMIRDVLFEYNYVHGNGTVGGDRHHNIYTEGVNFTYQYNRLDPLRAGSGGSNLKDRSANTIVRYNSIYGGAHLLDLVDPEESYSITASLPSYRDTYVYGNVMRDGGGVSGSIVHYGGDTGVGEIYRKGTLHFYNNTILVQKNQSTQWRTAMFQLSTNGESADIRNNIFYTSAAVGAPSGTGKTQFTFAGWNGGGQYSFGTNWVSPGWVAWRDNGPAPVGASMTGTNNFINNTANDPGFVNLAAYDLHLLATAQPGNKGQILDAEAAATNPLTKEYVYHQAWDDRTIFGAALDLGAFEYESVIGGNTPPTISDVTNQSSTGSPVGPLAFTVGDAQTAVGSLVVTRSSSNTTLLPLANIVLGGTGASRTVLVTPVAGQTGSATVTLTVTDAGGLTATDTFVLTVTAPNTAPTISDVTNQSSTGSPVGPLAFTVGDAQTAVGSLVVTRSSSNTTLLPLANIVLGGTGASRTVLVTPVAGQTGSATVTLTVTDAGGLTATDTFVLTVTAANTAPTISDVTNQSSTGSPVGPLAFTVGDAQTAVGSLVVTRSSSNTTLLPLANIVLGGTGASRTVLVTPVAGQTGSATVTLTVTDAGGLTATDTFVLTVTAANTAPTISDVTNQSSTGSPVGPLAFTVGDAQTAVGSLVVTRSSSNTTLLPLANIVLGGTGANRTVLVTPVAGQTGSATVTLTVTDAGGLTATDTFTLTVTAANTAPTISDVTNQSSTGSPVGPLAFTVGDAQTAVGSLVVTRSSSNTTLLPLANIVLGGTGASRTVLVTPVAGQTGSATVTLTVTDAGGLTATDTFVLTVTAANTAPTISDVTNQSSTGSPVGPLAFTVGDAQTAVGSLVVTRSSSNTTLLPLANIVLGGTGANRTVLVTPVAGQTGSATVTLTVTDAGGLTATDTFTLTVTAANTAPTISDVTNQSSTGSPVGPLAFTVGDAQTAVGSLVVTRSSSNTTLLPLANIVLGGTGANRTVLVTPVAGQTGSATVTLTVTDAGGLTATDTFTLTVTNPNSGVPATLIGFKQFIVGADAWGDDTVTGDDSVNFYDPDGTIRFSIAPFPGQTGGIRTAAGDFTGDGIADLVVGTGPGGPTHVKVFDGATQAELFHVDPFESAFTGGIYVAVGDINGDGVADLAITPDEGGGPRVRAFTGTDFTQIADFYGIDDPKFRGGARASIGDLNGDGSGDLIIVAGFQGGPRVAAYDGKNLVSNGGPKLFNDFYAFEKTLRNGIFVAAGDVNGDGFADLVAGGGPGGGPRVYILDGKSLVENGSSSLVSVGNFFVGDQASRGGVRVAVKNLDNDAMADVVIGAGTGDGSHVTAYRGTNITPIGGTPPAFLDFDSFAGFGGGVFVG